MRLVSLALLLALLVLMPFDGAALAARDALFLVFNAAEAAAEVFLALAALLDEDFVLILWLMTGLDFLTVDCFDADDGSTSGFDPGLLNDMGDVPRGGYDLKSLGLF